MRVFVTGASGFIGQAVVAELISHGHSVLGMTRSDEGEAQLKAAGAEPYRATLEELDKLTAGAAQADGVIHLAFNHDFSRFVQNCEDDKAVIAALAAGLKGTDKPLVITSGAAITTRGDGTPAMEDDPPVSAERIPRAMTENAAQAALDAGINVSIVRLPQVHDTKKQGFVGYLVTLAREKGVSAYVGEGKNRWTAAHVSDVARLYRLALEAAKPGAKYHAVAEGAVPLKAIAEAIGKAIDVPVKSLTTEEASAHFGWMAMFAAGDSPSSSEQTKNALNWTPTGPTLMDDLSRLES